MPPTALLASTPVPPGAAAQEKPSHEAQRLDSQPLSQCLCSGLQIVGFNLPEVQEHRLRTMGLFEGQIVQLIKKSNPVIIKVAGARMALAREIAGGVYVAPAADELQ